MSRPIEYKREEVLEAATHVFWKKGFNSTSMNDLVEATGLNKHSMYGEFKSKEGLFLECIDNYVNKSTKSIADILAEKPLGIRNIKAFFENRIEYASSGECDGCLLVNTAVEGKTLNDKLNKIVNNNLYVQKTMFYSCLRTAQENGEIPKEKDCKMLADYLMCFLEGLMVMGKTNPTKKSVNKIMDTVMQVITK